MISDQTTRLSPRSRGGFGGSGREEGLEPGRDIEIAFNGMRPGEPNVGLKLHAEEVGKGIAEREQGENIAYGVLDPSAFKEARGRWRGPR